MKHGTSQSFYAIIVYWNIKHLGCIIHDMKQQGIYIPRKLAISHFPDGNTSSSQGFINGENSLTLFPNLQWILKKTLMGNICPFYYFNKS